MMGLKHDNIITVSDVVLTRARVYFAMPLLDGSIASVIERRVDILDWLPEITYQLLSALAYAHSAGVVHRDVTPNNIFVSYTIEDQKVVKLKPYIGDWGSALLNRTLQATPYGTRPAGLYAPELLTSTQDTAVDMWGLGASLYWIITEMLPPVNTQKFRESIEEYQKYIARGDDKNLIKIFDLIDKMININPRQRITAREALKSPLFSSFPKEIKLFEQELVFPQNLVLSINKDEQDILIRYINIIIEDKAVKKCFSYNLDRIIPKINVNFLGLFKYITAVVSITQKSLDITLDESSIKDYFEVMENLSGQHIGFDMEDFLAYEENAFKLLDFSTCL